MTLLMVRIARSALPFFLGRIGAGEAKDGDMLGEEVVKFYVVKFFAIITLDGENMQF